MSVRDHSLEHNNRGHVCDFTLDYFNKKHGCHSLLDIGAGKGLNCAWATKYHGYQATGIEVDAECEKVHDDIRIHNFVTDGVCQFDRRFDLGWSVATSEHIDESGTDDYVKTLRACDWVVFTWCTPGYGGYHHVNEREQSYWIKKFTENGFQYDETISKLIRTRSVLKMIKTLDKSKKQVYKGYLKDWGTVFKKLI